MTNKELLQNIAKEISGLTWELLAGEIPEEDKLTWKKAEGKMIVIVKDEYKKQCEVMLEHCDKTINSVFAISNNIKDSMKYYVE